MTVGLLASLLGAVGAPPEPAGAQASDPWTVQASGAFLYGVACPSVATCVAVGAGGTILTSGDGGTSWTARTSGTTQTLTGVACPSTGACVAVGDQGTILTSGDSGATWAVRISGTTQQLRGVACPSVATCVAVGNGGTIVRGTVPTPAPPDLAIAKAHTGSFTVGQQGTYTLMVSNAAAAGPTTGTITVTDTLPSGLTYVSGTGTGWSCGVTVQVVICTNPGPLAANASSAIALTVDVGAAAAPSVMNSASVATPGETATGNNTGSDTADVAIPGQRFYPLASPVRLLDTRSGANITGCVTGTGAIAAGATRTQAVNVASTACASLLPAGAAAIVGNVTAITPSAGGYLTLWPGDVATRPTVANVNYAGGAIANNAYTVGVDASSQFKLFSFSQSDVTVDVTGYYAPTGTSGLYYHPLASPVRLLDTRSGGNITGCVTGTGAIAAGDTRTQPVNVASTACASLLPAGASAIVGNVTAVQPAAGGFLTLYPGDVATRPTVANVNYAGGDIVNNAYTVGVDASSQFKLFSFSQSHVVVDVSGYYDANPSGGLLFKPLPSPVRLLDTRSGPNISGCTTGTGALGAGETRTDVARGACTVPATAQAIVGNATAVNLPATSLGYLTLFPSNVSRPTVANVNYSAGGIVNTAYNVGLGPTDGAIKTYAFSQTHVVLDVSGYFAAP